MSFIIIDSFTTQQSILVIETYYGNGGNNKKYTFCQLHASFGQQGRRIDSRIRWIGNRF